MFFPYIPYDYMPKGSYFVAGKRIIFKEGVPEELKKRFLADYKKNKEMFLEKQRKRMTDKDFEL